MTSAHHASVVQHSRYPMSAAPGARDERRLPSLKDLNFPYRSPHTPQDNQLHPITPISDSSVSNSVQENAARHSQSWPRPVVHPQQSPSPSLSIHQQNAHQQQQHTPPLSAGHESSTPKIDYASKQDTNGFLIPGVPLSAQSTPVPNSISITQTARSDDVVVHNQLKRPRKPSSTTGTPRDVRATQAPYPPQYAPYPPPQPPPPGPYHQMQPVPPPVGHPVHAPMDTMQHSAVPMSSHAGYGYQYIQSRTHPQHQPPPQHPQHSPHQPPSTHGNPYPTPGPPSAPPPQGPWDQQQQQQQPPPPPPPSQHPQHPHAHLLPPPQHVQPSAHPHAIQSHHQSQAPPSMPAHPHMPPQQQRSHLPQHPHSQHSHPPPPPPPHHQPPPPQTPHQPPPTQSQPIPPPLPPSSQLPQQHHPQHMQQHQQHQQPHPPTPTHMQQPHQHQHHQVQQQHQQHQIPPSQQQQPIPFARTTPIVPTTVDARQSYPISEQDRMPPPQPPPPPPPPQDRTIVEIVEQCSSLYTFASRYAQLQASLPHVQPTPAELAEMSQRAVHVVRLLEEYRRVHFPDTERPKIDVPAVSTPSDDHRTPKRPWEDMNISSANANDNNNESSSLAEQQYPTPIEKHQSTAEQDMEIIRTKRATSAVGGGGNAGQPKSKYRKRSRATPPGKCHSCNIRETPEWRRGPDGARTLCNACGLHYAKLMRKRDKNGDPDAPRIDLETLRASARAADVGGDKSRSNKFSRVQQANEPTSPSESGKQQAQTQTQQQQQQQQQGAAATAMSQQSHHQGSFQVMTMVPPSQEMGAGSTAAAAAAAVNGGHEGARVSEQQHHHTMSQGSAHSMPVPPPTWATSVTQPQPPPPPPTSAAVAAAAASRGYAPEQLQHQSFIRSSQHPSANLTSPR